MQTYPKVGTRVTVPAFDATVMHSSVEDASYCTELRTVDGYTAYVFYTQLELKPPYEVGKVYLDADGEKLEFVKSPVNGKYGWRTPGGTHTSHYDFAARPLRLLGDEISEN